MVSQYTFVLSTPYLAHVTPHYQTCDIDTKLLGDMYVWLVACGTIC